MPSLLPRLRIVPPLPTLRLQPPWSMTFALLDQSPAYPFLLTHAEQFHLDMEAADRRIALYWVIKKKWLPRLKMPANRNYSRLLEPWGELMFQTLELAIAWHSLPTAPLSPYRNAADCYLQVMLESQQIDTEEVLANEPRGKKPFIKSRSAIISQLKAGINPADPILLPHFSSLMNASLELERRDAFNEQYWKPFVRACSKWVQALDTPECQEVCLEGDYIKIRRGKGGSKRTIIRLC